MQDGVVEVRSMSCLCPNLLVNQLILSGELINIFAPEICNHQTRKILLMFTPVNIMKGIFRCIFSLGNDVLIRIFKDVGKAPQGHFNASGVVLKPCILFQLFPALMPHFSRNSILLKTTEFCIKKTKK